MIFRITQKLNTILKAGDLASQPQIEDPFADWSANFFIVDRRRYIVVSNTTTLYTVLLEGKGITNGRKFAEQFKTTLQTFMREDGLEAAYQERIEPSFQSATFAKSLNRKVTGSLCELVQYARFILSDGNDTPYTLGFRLNDLIYSAIGSKPGDYARPKVVFTALAKSAAKANQ